VVLNFTTINDVKDNSKALNIEYASQPIPYFAYRDNKLVLDDSLLQARNQSFYFRLQQTRLGQIVSLMRDHLRIFALIDRARIAYTQKRMKAEEAARAKNVAAETLGWDEKVYHEPTDPEWTEAWHITEGLVTMMRDDVSAKGAAFLVVTGTSGLQVSPDPNVRLKELQELKIADFTYPDRRIKALGERDGFAVLNLAPAMQQYAEAHQVFLHGQRQFIGQGHWNREGHRVAGELIAAKLCTNFLLQK